jgi:hypothetical protein
MRTVVASLVILGLAALALPEHAVAGDGIGRRRQAFCRGGEPGRSARPLGDRGCACAHVRRFHERGQGWALLRHYLDRDGVPSHHRHARHWFFDRWPCASNVERPVFEGLVCPGTDRPFTECPIAEAALDTEGAAAIDPATLAPEARLTLAMERFRHGAFEDAATDFGAVESATPDDARAVLGLLMCAVMQSDHGAAARRLRRLHELGRVSGRDRLLLDECFAEPKRFLSARDGLAAYGRWHFQDAETLVVAAWTHAVTGDRDAARKELRAALRFRPDHPVALRLRATLDEEPVSATTPNSRAQPGASPRTRAEAGIPEDRNTSASAPPRRES